MTGCMEITTVAGCRFACSYCPQKNLVRQYKKTHGNIHFDMDDFKSCIDKIPSSIRIDFSGYAEPFLHPNCHEMVEYVKSKGHVIHIYSTLMGIIDFSILNMAELVMVHLPDRTGLIIPDDQWIPQHEKLVQVNHRNVSYTALEAITDGVESYLTQRGVRIPKHQQISRGGNLVQIQVQKKTGKLDCAMNRWHSNTLMPNGDVQGCCMDYGLTVTLGNLLKQSYDEIWNEAERWKNNDHSNDICSTCEWSKVI